MNKNTTAAQPLDLDRATFEAMFNTIHPSAKTSTTQLYERTHDDRRYCSFEVEYAWQTYLALIAQARAAQPVAAWMTEDGERVVSAATKAGQERDGGACASAMRPYSVPLVRAAQPAGASDTTASAGGERKGWEAAAKALYERAAGHFRNKDYALQVECLQCAYMLHDMKPSRATLAPVEAQPKIIVSLGDLYADACKECGARGWYGIATQTGPDGCREALTSGEVYCDDHLPKTATLAPVAAQQICQGCNEMGAGLHNLSCPEFSVAAQKKLVAAQQAAAEAPAAQAVDARQLSEVINYAIAAYKKSMPVESIFVATPTDANGWLAKFIMDAIEHHRPDVQDVPRASPASAPTAASDLFGICLLVAEAAYKEGSGRDRAVARDKLKPIVDDVLNLASPEASQQAAAVAAPVEMRIGVSVMDNVASIVIMQPIGDGSVATIYTGTHPNGDSHGGFKSYTAPTAVAATASEDARDAARLAEGYESGFFASSPQDGDGQFTLHYKTAAQAEAAYMLVTGIIDSAMRATQQDGSK